MLCRRDRPRSASWNRVVVVAAGLGIALLSACGGADDPVPTSIAFADNENAASLNGITVICESDGVTVHSERHEIENIVLSVDGVHTRVDNIFAFDFVVAGAFDRMTVDSDPTDPEDSLPENRIEALWIKAGDNLSVDGPGYGQRMECPTVEVEAAREVEATKNYVEHEFDSGAPAGDSAAVDETPAEVDEEIVVEELAEVDEQGEYAEPSDDQEAVSLADIGVGPQVFGAGGAIVLTCGAAGIDVRAENSELASVVVFDNDTGEDLRFTTIDGASLTLVGNFGDVTAVTIEGAEANLSCSVANRRANRGPSGS